MATWQLANDAEPARCACGHWLINHSSYGKCLIDDCLCGHPVESLLAGAESEAAEAVNHPAHYGGESNPYEAIKVIEAWGLGFCLGNTVKYISRAGKKDAALQDLKKAAWYLAREIANREKEQMK